MKYNGVLEKPENPVKEGYEFAGWYADEELTIEYDFDDKLSKSITLYAKWEEVGMNGEVSDDTPILADISYADVTTDAWYYDSVQFMAQNKLMFGVSDSEFGPQNILSRAMLVTMLHRYEGETETSGVTGFDDVKSGSYYEKAVSWATENNIVSGITEKEFAPDNSITREQIAAILFRYVERKGYVTEECDMDLSKYSDAENISEYAVKAMEYAVKTGLISGRSKTTLNPEDSATRAEIAVILQRFIELYR